MHSMEEWHALREYRILRSKGNVPNIFLYNVYARQIEIRLYTCLKEIFERNKLTN